MSTLTTPTATPTTEEWNIAIGADALIHRSRLNGSEQQEEFWSALTEGDGNIILSSRAGTGKSTSCREGMWRLIEKTPDVRIRYCTFASANAEEFRQHPLSPKSVEAGTIHRFCFQALKERRPIHEPCKEKTYVLLDSIKSKLPRYLRKAVEKTVSLAKNLCFSPYAKPDARFSLLNKIVEDYDIETWGRTDNVVETADEILELSEQRDDLVDFDDMLWLSWLFEVSFPAIDFLVVDEAQDLNPVQHALVSGLVQGGRTVAVGDPFQAIYAFRGADSNSLSQLGTNLCAEDKLLTVTYRCPRSHVELARSLVPDFEAHPTAPQGEITYGTDKEIEAAQAGDLVICRTNAPLITACLKAIGQRRSAFVRGRSIGDQLEGILRRVDAKTIPQFLKGVDAWKHGRLTILAEKEGVEDKIEAVHDQAASLAAIAESCSSPSEVPGAIKQIFGDQPAGNRIQFSSIHRAKGMEARRVSLIDVPYRRAVDRLGREKRVPEWQLEQQRNLRYVGLTRSLDSLSILSLEEKERTK